jgi:hypothetical protein
MEMLERIQAESKKGRSLVLVGGNGDEKPKALSFFLLRLTTS